MAKYTFLVPAYKPRYLEEALRSMTSQTFRDFRIIVSDDCSPHDIGSIVNPFIKSYGAEQITLRRNAQNIGGKRLVEHWNKLVGLCDSEWVIMASDDDVYSPRFLEEAEELTSHYPGVDVLRMRGQRINENDELRDKEDIFDEYQIGLEAIHSAFCGNYLGCIGNYIFRTEALKKLGGFINLPYAWFSDLLTAVAMARNGQANSSEPLFNFRLSGINISDTKKDKKLDREKLRATIGYDEEMCKLVAALQSPSNLYEERLLHQIVGSFKHRAYRQAGDYSWAVPIWKWTGIYNRMKQQPYFSKGSFLKYFGEAVLNRWFARFAAK